MMGSQVSESYSINVSSPREASKTGSYEPPSPSRGRDTTTEYVSPVRAGRAGRPQTTVPLTGTFGSFYSVHSQQSTTFESDSAMSDQARLLEGEGRDSATTAGSMLGGGVVGSGSM